MVKNLRALQEIWVRSLGREDALEKGTAAHSSVLAWRIPWTEEPGGLLSVGSNRVGHGWGTNTTTPLLSISVQRRTILIMLGFLNYEHAVSLHSLLSSLKVLSNVLVVFSVQVLDFLLDTVPCVSFTDFWSNFLPSTHLEFRIPASWGQCQS